MTLHWSPMAAALIGTAATDLTAAAWAWRRRGATGRVALVAMLLAAAAWCAAYGLELAAVGRGVREFWGSLEYVGTTLLPPAWLVFVLTYTGGRPPSRRLLRALSVEPVAVLALLAVPVTHDLLRSFEPGPLGPVPAVRLGDAYWIHFAWTTGVSLSATTLLVVRLLRLTSAYRRQSATLAVAAAAPLLGNAASSFGLGWARTYDPTPLAVSVGGLVLVWGAFRFRLLDLIPLARTLAFDRLGDPILVVDVLGRIVDRNPAAVQMLGAGAQVGATLQRLLEQQAAVLDATAAGAEVRIGGDGGAREYELVTSTVNDAGGRRAGQLVHLRDITERKRAERHLQFLAENDPLTGLPNRRLLADRLSQAIARSQRSRGRCALLLFDLDRFKGINDSFGHPTGDRVLEQVAARLRAGRRDEDTVARLSGDEFAVLLPEVSTTEDAARVAGRALAGIAEPMRLDGHELRVTASAGVAVWPDDGLDARQLLGHVDAAMYLAKAGGRNVARTRGRGTAAAVGRDDGTWGELGDELRAALDADELDLRFRPVIDLRDASVTTMEAVLRWRHPRHGELHPPAFLPVAAELGLLERVDRWVLARACGEACRWTRAGRRVPVSVPVSPQRLHSERRGLSADVVRVLELTTLPADLLALRIGERAVADDAGPVSAELRTLHRLGVGLTLDRFGAEQTSLTHLRGLPITTLRLDRDLTDAARDDASGVRVLTAVTTLAHVLGMTVVAGGVTRPDAVPVLRRVGCDAAAGPTLCRPLDADAADALVSAPVLALPVLTTAADGEVGTPARAVAAATVTSGAPAS